MRMPIRLLPLFLVLLIATPVAHAAGVDPTVAASDLEQLQSYLKKKKKSLNEDLIAYLNDCAKAYNNFEMPAKPADDATEEEQKAYQAVLKKAEKEQDDFNKGAMKSFFKCLAFSQLDRSGTTNLRDDVNRRAAQVLGELAKVMDEADKKDTSKKLIKAIEKLDKAKYKVNSENLDAMFASLGQLNQQPSLEWMMDEFIHSKNSDEQVVLLIAAHKAMILFKDVPGGLRYDICDEMTKIYSSVESQAEQSSADKAVQAAKAFWDRIRVDSIRVVQYYAGEPADSEGVGFNTMTDLYYWFKEHKNKRKAPWVDAKKK